MSGDVNVARQLVAAKTLLREKEFAAAERYLSRLREGRRRPPSRIRSI